MVNADFRSLRRTGSTDTGEGLRILIENSEYWLRNNGDLAMLAVTLRRLRQRWPQARIAVLTDTPALLRAYFPDAEAITVFDADPWAAPGPVQRLAGRLGPATVGPVAIGKLRSKVWLRQKSRGARRRLAEHFPTFAAPALPTPPPVPRGTERAMQEASLLLSLGGGYLTDADPSQSRRVLNLVEHACDLDVRVAMVGQGLGPLDDPALRARAGEVLPRVDLIALRESRRGPALLADLGVPAEHTAVTGDDAIELAYAARSEQLGNQIGLCLRIAGYSPVTETARLTVGQVARDAATELFAELAPLIIAEYQSQDRRSTLPLTAGYPCVVRPPGRYVHPDVVARRVARCRVMVTGAYHLAVFALAQGIPVVGLSSSAYYDDKLLGLGEMFSGGVRLVRLDADDLEKTLAEEIRAAWERSPTVRDSLRARAVAQIATSKAGFERVFSLVEPHDG